MRVLSFHADYACRHSGACCSAGWRIPVEERHLAALERAAAEARLAPRAALTESRGGLTVLRLAGDGTCTAFEPADERTPAACAIHRALGPDALPVACQHFPRVVLQDSGGVAVTLSHFCPTAVGLLFEDAPIRVIAAPPGFSDIGEPEGLDARSALPPLLAPGMLMDLDAYRHWETWALGVLDTPALTPEQALSVLRAGADHCRTWTPANGPLVGRVAELHQLPSSSTSGSVSSSAAHFRAVLACVQEGLVHPGAHEPLEDVDGAFVAGEWPGWSGPLRRYLAGRLHASWVPYQGRGLRTVVRSLEAAIAVVRVEAARQCALAGGRLDRTLLAEAIRMSDLLLVHEADAQALADTWSLAEREDAVRARG